MFPGCGASRSDAPLIRDRSGLSVCNDPGSAAHHFASLRDALRPGNTEIDLALHPPPPHRRILDGAEDHAFDEEADEDNGEETCKHVGGFQLIAVLEDEPAKAAGARAG